MFFIPDDTLQKLELDKVIALIQGNCMSEVSKAILSQPVFHLNKSDLNTALSIVAECKEIILEGNQITINEYEDINDDVNLLKTDGYVLPLESILKLDRILRNYFSFVDFMTPERRQSFPFLNQLLHKHPISPVLKDLVSKIIDEEGNVRRNASPALAAIYRAIDQKSRETNKVFNQLVGEFKSKGLLSDIDESYRHGRRVLAVPAEYKRRINGIIHDESATGKTVFIEPQSVVLLNNEILELESDKRKEIYLILKAMCDQLRPLRFEILSAFDFVTQIDINKAKARFAISINGVKPELVDGPTLDMLRAVHPLLYLKQKNTTLKTIPFDLKLFGANKLILISGPNAGGKSITMKATGLLQLMLQMGCLVSLDPKSKMGVYQSVCTDIGDQQSIEDDLSTYSSRLLNMKNFIEKADSKTLLLIDEFGSGTDPKIGGAIAEAILHALIKKGVYGVITTHYSNLKIYAYKTKGIVNGAMHFDDQELKPTYQLMIGKPGSSFAYEIAEKIGLQKHVINYAKNKTGKTERAVDNLLINLQREKKSIEGKLQVLTSKESDLDRLIKTYSSLQKELDYKRKKYKLEQKEFALQKSNEVQKEINKVVQEIRDTDNLKQAQSKSEAHQVNRKKVEKEVKAIKEELFYKDDYTMKAFEVGDFVQLRSGGMSGQIVSISKRVAEVQTSNMTISIPITDLAPSKEPLQLNPKRRITTDLEGTSSGFKNEIDIRGYRKNEAEDFIQEFMDKALIANVSDLTILHGKGNGVLKRVVHQKLKEYSDIKEIGHPKEEAGGEGITLVKL